MRTNISASVGRNGRNHPADVDTILHLINVYRSKRGKEVLAPRKKCDTEMLQAIAEFQSSVLGDLVPTGVIQPNSLDVAHLKCPLGIYRTPKAYAEPSWLAVAAQELGVREASGLAANNPRILDYLSTVPGLSKLKHVAHGKATQHLMSGVDETAWCACFVKWCLTQAGIKQGLRDARARSWRTFGSQSTPKVGAITVIYRTPFGDSSSGWHVGFYVGGPPDAPALLGGNQNNMVCFSQYYDLKEIHYRWPKHA